MASLDEKFAALKAKLEGYRLELKDATSREELSLLGLIHNRVVILNADVYLLII